MNKFKFFILSLNKYKIVRIIKWALSLCVLQIIYLKKYLFKKGIRSGKKRRLFSTTGNLSLINALTIIDQLGDKNCEDYLIIESFSGGYNFWKNNYEIAKLHKFKNIRLVYNIRFITELRLINCEYFDEIYMLNHIICIPPIIQMYPDAEINLFDEGVGSLVKQNDMIYQIKNLKHFYTHNYIKKIDYHGLKKDITDKIVNLETEKFQQIAHKIADVFPLTTKYNHQDKNILYCAIFWQASGLSEEQFVKVQKKQIEDLVNAGYKILFKPHPRETKFYGLEKNPNVIFVNSVLPVEVYNWDILAITGMNCTTLVHLPHYHNIPSFSNIVPIAVNSTQDSFVANLTRFIASEYSPNYKELLKLDVKNTPREKLKEQIKKIYDDFIKDKPLLSQNKKLEEFV